MAISQLQTQNMQAAASGATTSNSPTDYTSLGDMFKQQYDRLYKTQQAQDAYTPTASANAAAIGNIQDRASGEAPVAILEQGMGVSSQVGKIKEGTTANILSTLSEMMNLQKQKDALVAQKEADARAERELKLKEDEYKSALASKGLKIDETGEPVAMTEEEKQANGYYEVSPKTAAYIKLFENGSMKKVSEIPAEDRGSVVEELARKNINIINIAKKAEGNAVSNTLKTIYDRYTGANQTTEDDLSKGRFGGATATLGSWIGTNPDVKQYNALRKGLAGSLKQLTGDTGIMTDQDREIISGLLPAVTATPEEAKKAWEDINKTLISKYGIDMFGQQSVDNKPTSENEYDPNSAIARYKKEKGIK